MWRYEVRPVGDRFDELAIEGDFPPGSTNFGVDGDVAAYVRDVAYADGPAWKPLAPDGDGFSPPCGPGGCRLRYRFELHRAALAVDDVETALASGDVTVAPPGTWLLRPDPPAAPARFRFHVTTAPGAAFVAGTRPAPDGAPDTYEADVRALEASSFAVFGPFHRATLRGGGALVEVAIAPRGVALADRDIERWVQTAVDAIAAYFGKFPAPRALVVFTEGGSGGTRGETLGDGGPGVLIRVGGRVTAATIGDDWVVTHELLHVSMPALSRGHAWLDEGIASYVEPIVRVRAGLITPEKLWGDLVDGMPQGLPEPGDEGLERTHTWGRTYWGGALFCLMADVTLRERTANARSLDDVLRGIAATGAHVETHWPIERWIDEARRATGTDVVGELYRDMALAPGTVDLPGLWARLGVRTERRPVTFDDGAPFASIRRAISNGR